MVVWSNAIRRLILVFAVAVAFAQVQCVSACAVESGSSASAPPCHQHEGSKAPAPDSCAYHLVISPATAPQIAHANPALIAITPVAPASATVAQALPFALDSGAPSPPVLKALSSIVLRI